VAEDSAITYADSPVGNEVEIGGYRYETVPDNFEKTNLVNANGVHLIQKLDKNITISGDGKGAVLDGAGVATGENHPNPSQRWRWLGVNFELIENLQVSGLTLRDTVRFAINCSSGCYNADFRDLNFEQRGWDFGRGRENSDCLNIRHASRNIRISNISGTCGDDSVALTTLHKDWHPVTNDKTTSTTINTNFNYFGDRSISHVTIDSINTLNVGGHHDVRLLSSDDIGVHHVSIRDISDFSSERTALGNEWEWGEAQAAILVNSARYGDAPDEPCSGVSNVTISDVHTSTRAAGSAIFISDDTILRDSAFSDVYVSAARHAVYVGFRVQLDNVAFTEWTIRNLGQMALRVRDTVTGRGWTLANWTVLDRDRLWPDRTDLKGRFYSLRNDAKLRGDMPVVTARDSVPVPVDGSHARFEAGVGGFAGATDAIGDGDTWVAR
jgi:hypothetical protein